jgi:hypothetical protein
MRGETQTMIADWIAAVPLWGMFVLTFALCLFGEELGAALSRLALRRAPKDPDAPLGSMVGALLGLLAFTVAFTFSMAAGRFDTRKQLVLREANAVETTYLRAALLPGKEGLEVRRLLRDYASLRLGATRETLHDVTVRSETMHRELWAQARLLAGENMDSEIRSLFLSSLNEVIELHQDRKTVALQYRIPGTVWLVLYVLTLLSMIAVGYQGGMSGARRMRGSPVLAAAFALMLFMISDLDRATEGFMVVSQQPMVDVRNAMAHDSP